jgi:hypothetical protein
MMQEYQNNTTIENNFVDISLDEGTTKEDEEDIIFEKKNIIIRKENSRLLNQDQQQVSAICFKNFCLNFWTNNVLAVPSNESMVIKNEKPQSINNIQSNFKKILQIDELDRKKMLDLESWNNNLENKRNFSSINNNNNNIRHQSMSNSVLYDKINRNQVLNQTLNLIKCSSLTNNNNSNNNGFNKINTESNDSLRSIISEFDKTFRLSSVSSVSGTFSFNDDDNQAYPIYKTSS